mmetsp:Transcript_17352/g.28499  ORF Transcript_17352/g.28499 Transcript_17352/m.28499 type:complete len:1861 (+) Transcript_17352:142-5724(+)
MQPSPAIYLPYSVAGWFAPKDILSGLEDCLNRNDMHKANYWCRVFNRHLDVKYPLSGSDRAEFARLFFQFIYKEIEMQRRVRWVEALSKVIDKNDVHLNLELQWRPLYELLCETQFPKSSSSLVYVGRAVRELLSSRLVKLIRRARRYFNTSAASEIWEELKPYLCPHDDVIFFRSQCLLTLFLPTYNGDAPWLPDFLMLKDWIANCTDWDLHFTTVCSRLAKDAHEAKIDSVTSGHQLSVSLPNWEPHYDRLFSAFLRDFRLPVGSSRIPRIDTISYPSECQTFLPAGRSALPTLAEKVAKWIVYMMQPNGKVQSYLDRLLSTILTYFHPSNSGDHSSTLARFIQSLLENFSLRIKKEREAGVFGTDKADALGPSHLDAFVKALLPSVNLAMYSKSHTLGTAANNCLKLLSYLSPDTVIPTLIMDKIYPALGLGDIFDERVQLATHQTIGALETLSICAHPIFSRQNNPQGAAYLVNLLSASLPGIDPNDLGKTRATIRFYISILYSIPLFEASLDTTSNIAGDDMMAIDSYGSSSAAQSLNSEADEEARSATFTFSDWVLSLLTRLFEFFSHLDDPDLSSKKSPGVQEQWDASLVQRMAEALFSQVSDPMFVLALDRLISLISEQQRLNATKQISYVVGAAVLVNPQVAFPRFSALAKRTLVEDPGNETDLMWNLRIYAQAVRRAGPLLVTHREAFLQIVDRCLAHSSKKVIKLGGKVLRYGLSTLTEVYPTEFGHLSPKRKHDPSFTNGPSWRTWGQRFSVGDEIDPSWHVPSSKEVSVAQEIITRYVQKPVQVLSSVSTASKDEVWCALQTIRQVVRGSANLLNDFFPIETLEPVDDTSPDVHKPKPNKRLPMVNAGQQPRDASFAESSGLSNLWQLLHKICGELGEQVSSTIILIKIVHSLLNTRGGNERDLHMHFAGSRKRAYSYFKGVARDVVSGKKAMPRALLIERAYLLHLARLQANANSVHFTPAHDALMHDLFALSGHSYSKVRKVAQNVLTISMKRFPIGANKLLPSMIDLLKEKVSMPASTGGGGGAEKEEKIVEDRVMGATYLLASANVMRRITRDWALLSRLILSIAETSHHEKLSLQARISHLFVVFSMSVRPLQLTTQSDSSTRLTLIDRILGLLGAQTENGTARPKLHWRYQMMLSSCLLFLLRNDAENPPSLASWFLSLAVSDLAPLRQVSLRCLSCILDVAKPPKPPPKYIGTDVAYGDAAIYASPTPVNEAEWDSTAFVDKVYIGWASGSTHARGLGVPINGAVASSVADGKRVAYDSLNAMFMERLSDAAYVEKLVSYLSSDHHYDTGEGAGGSVGGAVSRMLQFFGGGASIGGVITELMQSNPRSFDKASSSEAFEVLHSKLVQSIARNYGPFALDIFFPKFEEMSKSIVERDHQCCAAEIFAGLVRGSAYWPYDKQSLLWTKVRPILRKCLDSSTSNESAPDWIAAIRYCCSRRDPRRFNSWLVHDLVGAISSQPLSFEDGDNSTAMVQANRLRFVQPLLDEFAWKGQGLRDRLLELLMPRLRHPFKQVREEMGRTISFIIWSSDDRPLFSERIPTAHRLDNRPITTFFSYLIEELKQYEVAGISEEPSNSLTKDSPEAIVRFAFIESVLYIVAHTCLSGGGASITDQLPLLLPHLFSILRYQYKPELCAQTSYTLAVLSQLVLSRSELSAIVQKLELVSGAIQWHVRAASLPYIQLTTYLHMFALQVKDEEQLTGVVLSRLKDTQLEVREASSAALSALCRMSLVSPEIKPEALIKRFGVYLKSKVEVERHAGVLGLVALMQSEPYEMPDWMPAVVVKVASLACDPSSAIRTTVKKGFAEFRKSHSDSWAHQKAKFTEDQISALSNVMLSASYFA